MINEQLICETIGCNNVAVAKLDGFNLCYDCYIETKAENENFKGWDE